MPAILGNAVLSKFGYQYDSAGQITRWDQLQNGHAKYYDLSMPNAYDLAGQLQKANLRNSGDNSLIKAYDWAYDAAGNRTLDKEQTGGPATAITNTFTANNLNQLDSMSQSKALVQGELNRPVTSLKVNGSPLTPDSQNQFQTEVPLSGPTNSIEIEAQAADGAVTKNTYNVPATQALTYDENGNLTSDGARDFVWDAENRLVKVINNSIAPATITDFTYDGFSRRTRIKSTAGAGGPVLSDARYLWAVSQIAEERNTAGVVTKRFFSNGVQVAGGNLFYQRDHLGSIRGVTDSNGAVRGAYDFDLWGRRTRLSGDISADFGFTGHLENEATGLTLAWFRGYDSGMGRWISRDPIEERDALNLYEYVGGSPVNSIDPYGDMGAAPQGVRYGSQAIVEVLVALGIIKIIDEQNKEKDRQKREAAGCYPPTPEAFGPPSPPAPTPVPVPLPIPPALAGSGK